MGQSGRFMRTTKTLTRSTEFAAVDLNVRSRKSLTPLLNAWSPWVQTPGSTGSAAPRWLLVTLSKHPRTADAAIRAFVRMVDALPPSARRCWSEASSRTFDIGIQAGLSPYSFEDVRLQPQTIQDVSRLEGTLLITVYAPHRE
jgi:hypothetical protein